MFVSDETTWYDLNGYDSSDPTIDHYNDFTAAYEYTDRGAANKAMYLLRREVAEGSSSHHGVSVTGVGRWAASELYYTAHEDDYLGDYFTFRSLRSDMLDTAEALWGTGHAYYNSVFWAFNAIGIWGDFYNISPGAYGTKPDMAEHYVSGTSRVYLFWINTNSSDRLDYAYKPWGGSWSSSYTTTEYVESGTYPAVAGYDGELYAFYSEDSTCNIMYHVILSNGTFASGPTDTGFDSCYSPSAVAYDGELYLFYLNGTSIYYATFDGSGWTSSSSTGAGSSEYLSPSAAVANGSLWLYWVSSSLLRVKEYDGSWGSNVTLQDNSGDYIYTDQDPEVAEFKDRIHITTKVSGAGAQYLQYLVFDPSTASYSENVNHWSWGGSPFVGAMVGQSSDYVLFHVVKGTVASGSMYARTKNSW